MMKKARNNDDGERLLERIAFNLRAMVGKPVIEETHLTVEDVLNLLAHGAQVTEILTGARAC